MLKRYRYARDEDRQKHQHEHEDRQRQGEVDNLARFLGREWSTILEEVVDDHGRDETCDGAEMRDGRPAAVFTWSQREGFR